jgi:hypothetical protein
VQLKRRNREKIARNDVKLADHGEQKVQMKIKTENLQEAAKTGLERG